MKEEEQRRLSESVQRRMALAEQSGYQSWLDVAEAVQKETCLYLGIDESVGIRLMRFSTDDPDLNNISLYRRHNKVKPCSIKVGEKIPEIPLFLVTDQKEAKEQMVLVKQPFCGKLELIVTGSIT